MDAQALYHKIRTEEKREDKPFDYVEFNKRDSHIVMNIVYQTNAYISSDDHHTYRHDTDPEILNEETYYQLKSLLIERGIRFIERVDEFI